ncbi:hypothetical protein PENSTE_c002G04756 [Penicillium steckii]|uniref:Major facilitator superfamily (MFS) profile domain-containing protein n=1 Tax=Penicillium steckii TaxID=303698 RepID=A0A1V6TTC5_9EURO|nr:hypothetical protein PENSTE_c002G04756 [Penicillium steckii]
MNSTTTALPTISKALSADSTITWAGTAFLLGQTTFQPLYGRVSDIAGRKPVLLVSMACIMVGDFLSGWARGPIWLYVTRALSGMGAGGISSLVSIIVSDLVSLKDRGKYQGFVSIAIGIGAVCGPFLAASLIQKESDGWRWTFWVPSILAFSTQYFIPLFLQEVRGFSPLRSAMLTLPFVLAQSIAGAISGPLMSRLARFTPVLRLGLFLWSLGAGLQLLFDRSTHIVVYAVVLAIEGAGVGFTHQPGLVAVQALARTEDRAVATSTRNLLRSLGSVFGLAISTAAQRAAMQSALPNKTVSSINHGISAKRRDTFEDKSSLLDAKMTGYRIVFLSLVPLISLCFVGNFLVQDVSLNDATEESSMASSSNGSEFSLQELGKQ